MRPMAHYSAADISIADSGTRVDQVGDPVFIAVIVSRYNAAITEKLYEGALATFNSKAPKGSMLTRVDAPGSFELPSLALTAGLTGMFDGVCALGCLIKGETMHDRVIADAVAHGLVNVTMRTGMPVAFGVITADSQDQAEARAGGAVGNKGSESMSALLDTINSMDALWDACEWEANDELSLVADAKASKEKVKANGSDKKSGKKSDKKSAKNLGKKKAGR